MIASSSRRETDRTGLWTSGMGDPPGTIRTPLWKAGRKFESHT